MMKQTAKGRYAVTLMLDLSLYSQDSSVLPDEVAAHQKIPVSCLAPSFAKLRYDPMRGPRDRGVALQLPRAQFPGA